MLLLTLRPYPSIFPVPQTIPHQWNLLLLLRRCPLTKICPLPHSLIQKELFSQGLSNTASFCHHSSESSSQFRQFQKHPLSRQPSSLVSNNPQEQTCQRPEQRFCIVSNPASVLAYWGVPCLPASLSRLMCAFNIHLLLSLWMWIKRATCKANTRKITDCCCSLKLQLNRVW